MIKIRHVVIVGLLWAAAFWIFDSYLDAILFHEGTIRQQLFFPDNHEVWIRVEFGIFLFIFTMFSSMVIGQRDRLAAALQEAVQQADAEKAKSEAIIAAIGDGISIQDTSYRILYQNQVHKELVRGDYSGERCFQTYEKRDACCPGCPVEASFRDGQVHRLVKEVANSPVQRFIEITASPLRNAAGGIVAGIEVVRDITQRKRVELDLETANRELEAFSYSVSHDLRKPLTIIYTAAQALQEQYQEGEAGYFVQTICDASVRMDELIEALQLLSHVSRGELTREEVDLSALAMEASGNLQLLEPQRQVEWQITPGLLVQGDPRLFQLLMDNLLGNAWKFTGKRSNALIEFGLAETPLGPAYFVRDNGAGFDTARAGELFKPFKRLHASGEFPGTGIGLATVERIVQRHGGEVWAEGEVERGATFYFTLS